MLAIDADFNSKSGDIYMDSMIDSIPSYEESCALILKK